MQTAAAMQSPSPAVSEAQVLQSTRIPVSHDKTFVSPRKHDTATQQGHQQPPRLRRPTPKIPQPTLRIPNEPLPQKIPDLPSAPPTILQPLLERISIDLGLDDLTLLDLRKLDPPPALGSNLISFIPLMVQEATERGFWRMPDGTNVAQN
ncbi:hypothetical protein V495_03129 [Pseudogymnoascus sp. VKM F-4514 (FW-929)]|nr:hypothetical protein V495_03129 [Pseudogymnoascus sp. VKM F-4514 (FW-929)]